MADTDVWGLGGPIAAPAATDRVPVATGANAGGYLLLGSFAWKDASGRFNMEGGGANGAALINCVYTVSTTALRYTLNNGAGGGYLSAYNLENNFTHNAEFISGSGYVARHTDAARYQQASGAHSWTGNTGLTIGAAFTPTTRMTLTASGVLQPGSDNSQDLGAASFRWAVVRAGTGTINTCDVRFKLFRPEPVPTGDEHAAAIECFDAFGFYQFHEAIEAKGADGARWHFGPAAQQVWSIFASHGLADPLGEDGLPPEGSNPPAFLCFDKWGDQIEERPIYSDTLVDDAGFPLKIGSETIVLRAAGNIFGVRIDQLHSLMLVALNNERKGLADRIAALEAA